MIEHILKASLERDMIVTIMYQKGNEITRRNIKVLSIDNEHVKAYCYLRKENRVFRKKNILSAAFCSSSSLKRVYI
jgi:coproporphyrinogen III oxidase-like Fe-S oxidoreductase